MENPAPAAPDNAIAPSHAEHVDRFTRQARGPLSSMVGLMDLLIAPSSTPDQTRSCVEALARHADHINTLARSLLERTARAETPALAAAMNPGASGAAGAKVQLRGRVLLVDDSPDATRLIATHLRNAGAHVVVAEDGQVAVDALVGPATRRRAQAHEGFDLVLMDMHMPRLDGYGAVRTLRARGFQGPVIALTGDSDQGDRERCIASGCSEYLAKPVDRGRLLDACARYLR